MVAKYGKVVHSPCYICEVASVSEVLVMKAYIPPIPLIAVLLYELD